MDNKEGMSWGWLILIFLFFIVFGNDGGLFGGGNKGNCAGISNCEVEKQEIIDSARTQFLIESTSRNTQDAIGVNSRAIMDQNSRIYEAQQAEKLFDLKMENQSLKSNIFIQAQTDALAKQYAECCCALNRRLDAIECKMLPKPQLYGVATTCTGTYIPPITK